MQVFGGVKQTGGQLDGCVLTMGNFDGVHRGHQTILDEVREKSRRRGVPGVLLTFEPHPVQVLFPERHLKRLFPLKDLENRIEALGLQAIVIEPFTRELALYSPERFLAEKVLRGLHPIEIVVGHDFSFGAGRAGTIEFLRQWCEDARIQLTVQEPVVVAGERVSSRRIRDLVSEGDMEQAALFLGRRFYLEGVVEKGAGRGRTLGIPTANLRLSDYVVPRSGVYVTNTIIGVDTFRSVSNLGTNPTVQAGGGLKLETHILGFSGDLYGRSLQVQFLRKLRDEKKFASIDELSAQIRRDIESARLYREAP